MTPRILPAKGTNFEEHLLSFDEQIKVLFSGLRKIVHDRYEDVSEDVREHRIVFGKKTPLRWFLDALPVKEGVMLSIRSPEGQPAKILRMIIRDRNDLERVIPSMDAAYGSV